MTDTDFITRHGLVQGKWMGRLIQLLQLREGYQNHFSKQCAHYHMLGRACHTCIAKDFQLNVIQMILEPYGVAIGAEDIPLIAHAAHAMDSWLEHDMPFPLGVQPITQDDANQIATQLVDQLGGEPTLN